MVKFQNLLGALVFALYIGCWGVSCSSLVIFGKTNQVKVTEWSSWECQCWNSLKQRRTRKEGVKTAEQLRNSDGNCYAARPCMFELPGTFRTKYGNVEICPIGHWAVGLTTKVERSQGKGDDTAMNAIGLICRNEYIKSSATIKSAVGRWGIWMRNKKVMCKDGFNAARLKVEGRQGKGDDTATNSIQLRCNSGKVLEAANHGSWGKWKSWGHCPSGTKIIAIQTMVQPPQGSGDDTALNSVRFFCG